MAGSINKAIIVGNLGKEPDIRATQDGREVATLSIATSESWKDKQTGERKEKTEWHRIVIFNENIVKVAKQYLRKGSKIYVEGQLTTRKWTDKDGVDRYVTEIVLQGYNCRMTLLDKASDGNRGDAHDDEYSGNAPASSQASKATDAELDDEIPFAWLIGFFVSAMMLVQNGGLA